MTQHWAQVNKVVLTKAQESNQTQRGLYERSKLALSQAGWHSGRKRKSPDISMISEESLEEKRQIERNRLETDKLP